MGGGSSCRATSRVKARDMPYAVKNRFHESVPDPDWGMASLHQRKEGGLIFRISIHSLPLQPLVVSPTVAHHVEKAFVVLLPAHGYGVFAFRFQFIGRFSLGRVRLDCVTAPPPGADRRHNGSSLFTRMVDGIFGVYRHDVLGRDRDASLWSSPPPHQHRAHVYIGGVSGAVRRAVCLGIYLAGTTMGHRRVDRGTLLVGLSGVWTHLRVEWTPLGPVRLLSISMAVDHPDRTHHRRLRRVISHCGGERLIVSSAPLGLGRKTAEIPPPPALDSARLIRCGHPRGLALWAESTASSSLGEPHHWGRSSQYRSSA